MSAILADFWQIFGRYLFGGITKKQYLCSVI